jgi:hypothetical protein
MNRDRTADPLLRSLRHLPVLEPDAAHAARVSARCHTSLAGTRPAAGVSRATDRAAISVDAVLAAIGVAYLVAFVIDVLRVYGF